MDPRAVVITGVSRGLGHAMLEEFARRGHLVAGCSRSSVADLATKFPGGLFGSVDVCDARVIERWAKEIIQKVGAPDLLLNNAALVNENAPLWEVPPEQFSRVIDVNIKGVFHAIR